MRSPGLVLSATAFALLTPSAVAVPTLVPVQHAAVTLDLNTRHVVPVPGGSQLGIPVTNVAVTSDTEPLWDGTSCSGYSWTTTYDAGTEAEYTNVEVRLSCQTGSGVPFSVLEQGTGKNASTTLRRIQYDIGAPYEHVRSEFYVAEVITPVPDLTLIVYKVVQ